MPSRRERIVQALVGRIESSGWFESVFRGDPAAVEVARMPAAIVQDGGDASVELSPVHRRLSMRVSVDVVVRGTDHAVALSAIAEARARVLEVIAEPTLGGLASEVQYEGCTDPAGAETPGRPPELTSRLSLVVEYLEDRADPWA